MRIIDGVFALPLDVEFGGTTLTLHPALVELNHGLALIDTGLPTTTDFLESRIAETGHELSEVRLLIFTHQDGDHAGGGSHVANHAMPVVCAQPVEARPISGETEPRGPAESRYPPVPVDIELVEGSTFRTVAGPLEVIGTPGHTPGHISLFFRDSSLLLAADALTVAEGSLSGPHPQMSEDMDEAKKSIAHLAEYPVRSVLCYHGGYVQADPDVLRKLAAEG